jgi:hypothetical protein
MRGGMSGSSAAVQQPGLSAPDFATWKTIERYWWSN